jgi:hypothetical protein
MHPSFMKSKIFATLALLIMTVAFTFPMITFHGTLNKIHNGKIDEVSSLSKSVWNLYNKGRYKGETVSKESYNNFDKMVINSISEIGVASIPIWAVSLDAPAYPHGIPVFFHFDGFSGDVNEMNTINHFVGMNPMWVGGKFEREIGIYALLILTLLMIYFIAYNKKIFSYGMLIPISLPLLFIADYSYWLYWFGHNLHDWGAFKIKSFMPTVFGDGKIAKFTTHSYPTIGFYLLIAISLLSLLAFFARQKALSESGK